jgi:hypothetical protein
MDQKALRCGFGLAIAAWVIGAAVGVGAQESLDRGKNPAQLFASDCSGCHKSPQGLAKAGGLLGLDSFLREHYTASKESATAIANYIKSVDTAPTGPARAPRRTSKGDEKTKLDDRKRIGTKPGDVKGNEKSPDLPAAETKPSSEQRPPADIIAPEVKSEPRPSTPAAGESKPVEGVKSDKPEKPE